jgi:hypothetical protein
MCCYPSPGRFVRPSWKLGIPAGFSTELTNPYLPSIDTEAGFASLKAFAADTLRGLIILDETTIPIRANGKTVHSDLRVFCRLDISVLFHAGQYHWFVNEIAATAKAGLFLKFMGPITNSLVADYTLAIRSMVAVRRAGMYSAQETEQ